MGNNVLPARAGEALKVVLLSPRCDASRRTVLGSVVAERILDLLALAVIFVVVVYGALSSSVLPTDRPLLMPAPAWCCWSARPSRFGSCAATTCFDRARDWLRPLADAPRALLGRGGALLLAGTFVLWTFEATVYLAVARSVDLDFSVTGALYLVALTNFVAALPAAPGSIGTFDAAVAFGARRLGRHRLEAVSYMLLLRFVLYVPITLLGLVFLVVRYGGWSRLRSASVIRGCEAAPTAAPARPRTRPPMRAPAARSVRCAGGSWSASPAGRRRRGRLRPRAGRLAGSMPAIIAGCLVVAAISLLLPSTPTYDPWAWILLGARDRSTSTS